MRPSSGGLVASLGASVLFGLILYLSGHVSASPEVVFGWRVIVGALSCAAMFSTARFRTDVGVLLRALRKHPAKIGLLLLTAALVGYQFWLFMWAPQTGHALDVSLGYLLLPIVLVLGSRVLLRTPVTTVQWVVLVLAAVAVSVKIAAGYAPTWVTYSVCIPYAIYFIVRQKYGLDSMPAFTIEMTLLLPVALVVLVAGEFSMAQAPMLMLLTISLCASFAMWLYIAAARLLPLPLFGLLSYVEPVLLVGVALLLGESLVTADFVAYGILALALALLGVSGFRSGVRTPRVRPE